MTPVNIQIESNFQYPGGSPEPDTLAYTVPGRCLRTDDGIQLQYTEPACTGMENVRTTVNILQDGVITVYRGGKMSEPLGCPVTLSLAFERNRPQEGTYENDSVAFPFVVRTDRLECSFTEEGGCFDVAYSMEIQGQMASVNRLKLVATPASPLLPKKEGTP